MVAIFRILASRPGLLLGAAVCVAVYAASTALYAGVAGPVMVALTKPSDSGGHLLLSLGGLLVGTTIIRAAAHYGTTLSTTALGLCVVRRLSARAHAHVLRLSPRALSADPAAALGVRITQEVHRIRGLVQVGIQNVGKNAVTALFVVGLLIALDPILGAVAITAALAAVPLLVRTARRARALFEETWAADTELSAIGAESSHLVPLVRAYSAEGYAERTFDAQARKTARLALRSAALAALVGPLSEVLAAVGIVGALLAGLLRVHAGALTPEASVSALAAVVLLFRPLQAIASGVASGAGGLAALGRLEALLARPRSPALREEGLALPRFAETLELDDVHFAYGDRPVLRGVSLAVHAGESVAIVGENGAGKSSLLHLLMGLETPDRGVVRIDGRPFAEARGSDVRAQFSWVGQEPLLFRDTVARNVALGEVADPERVARALAQARAADFVAELPGGADMELEEGGKNLSVGQRQRLCIARALYRPAPILVLDEPTSSLDAAAEEELGETLETLLEGRTVILVTHRKRLLGRVDRVLELREGTLRERKGPAGRPRGDEHESPFRTSAGSGTV